MDELNEKSENNNQIMAMEAAQDVDEENMKKALMGVMFKGETPSCAARKYNVKRTTILYRLLRERKKCSNNLELSNNTNDCKSISMLPLCGIDTLTNNIKKETKFQSKFTSQQLLSAQQEENLSNYLKEKYELQLKETGVTALISETTARNYVHDFVKINNIRYPASWEPKQQAGGDWFNGFVDRNPEVIEWVAPAVKLRRRRRRAKYSFNKVNAKITKRDSSDYDHEFGQWAPNSSTISTPKLTNIVNTIQYDKMDNIQQNNNSKNEYTGDHQSSHQTVDQFKIKIENNYDSGDIESQSEAQFVSDNYYNDDPMVPELVYQNPPSPNADDTETSNSIAQNVKRRVFRKPRVIPEILYPRNHIQRKDGLNSQSFHENTRLDEANTSDYFQIQESNKKIETIMERMHEDMSRYMQAIIAQMMENTRLLKELVENQTKNSPH